MSHFLIYAIGGNPENDLMDFAIDYESEEENENGKFDYFEVGGRWNKLFKLKNSEELTFEAKIKDIDWDELKQRMHGETFAPEAYVLNGEWFEYKYTGQHLLDEQNKKKWNQEFEELLKTLDPELYITAVDCHM